MAVTYTQAPAYQIPDRPIRVSFSVGTGSYVKVFITDAPRASKHWEKLNESSASRILLHVGDGDKPWVFTPDASGKFTFVAQDVSKGATAYGGGYAGSPDGYQVETVNGSESSLTITVGSRVEAQLGAGDNTATLRFYIWDETVRATTTDTHGEETPAIIDASSERAEDAARAANTAVLVDVAIDTLLTSGSITTIAGVIDNMITNFNTHIQSASRHAGVSVPDTDNIIEESYKTPNNPAKLAASVAVLMQRYGRHISNDSGTGPGSASTSYHGVTAEVADYVNATVADVPTDPAGVVSALADFWRAYEAHRSTGSPVHSGSPGTGLTALCPLLTIVHDFMVEIAKTHPPGGTTNNPGALRLAAETGMTVT